LHQQVQESVTSNETTIGRSARQFNDPWAMILSDSVRGTLRMNFYFPPHGDNAESMLTADTGSHTERS
jgi:hypothetical protein